MIPQPFAFIGSIKLKVGMYYQGGFIVYLNDANTGGGLIAVSGSTFTATNTLWGPSGATSNQGAASYTYGSGSANTSIMINELGATSGAGYTSYNLVANGYDDWFLPSRNEAYYVNQQKALFPYWTGAAIWTSSTQASFNNTAWYIDYDGTQNTDLRSATNNRNVIACRYITG